MYGFFFLLNRTKEDISIHSDVVNKHGNERSTVFKPNGGFYFSNSKRLTSHRKKIKKKDERKKENKKKILLWPLSREKKKSFCTISQQKILCKNPHVPKGPCFRQNKNKKLWRVNKKKIFNISAVSENFGRQPEK